MGLRFRKSVKIAPPASVLISARKVSVSVLVSKGIEKV